MTISPALLPATSARARRDPSPPTAYGSILQCHARRELQNLVIAVKDRIGAKSGSLAAHTLSHILFPKILLILLILSKTLSTLHLPLPLSQAGS
jgi:hypothetical protein